MPDKTDLCLSKSGNGEVSKGGLYTFHFTAFGSGATRPDALNELVTQVLRAVVLSNIKPKKFIIRQGPTELPDKGHEYQYKCKFSLSEDVNYSHDY